MCWPPPIVHDLLSNSKQLTETRSSHASWFRLQPTARRHRSARQVHSTDLHGRGTVLRLCPGLRPTSANDHERNHVCGSLAAFTHEQRGIGHCLNPASEPCRVVADTCTWLQSLPLGARTTLASVHCLRPALSDADDLHYPFVLPKTQWTTEFWSSIHAIRRFIRSMYVCLVRADCWFPPKQRRSESALSRNIF